MKRKTFKDVDDEDYDDDEGELQSIVINGQYPKNVDELRKLSTNRNVSSYTEESAGGRSSVAVDRGAAADGGGVGLGTLAGVFFPCLQNILGVILFLRLPWITGQAGILLSILIVFICVSCTFITTLSMSALATNGTIKGSGAYSLINKSMGPEFGGSIGILFYLATTIAGSMYILGGVEAVKTVFELGDLIPGSTCEISANGTAILTPSCGVLAPLFPFDNQTFAIISTIVLASVVLAGMSVVSKVAPLFLLIVLLAIFLLSVGCIIFAAGVWFPENVLPYEPDDNIFPVYETDPVTNETPSFTSLLALFFPSVTGIMAGANRSAVLKTPGKSIPKGTLSAIFTTTIIYIFVIVLFGLSIANETLLNNKLVAASVAWPSKLVVGLGIAMSCVGAALQCLAGAPQLLSAIANDGHIQFLRIFATVQKARKVDNESSAKRCCNFSLFKSREVVFDRKKKKDPVKAILITAVICGLFCLPGTLDFITPIITIFFLGTYMSVNLACFLAAFYKSPSFRPSWKYFHWSTALLGVAISIVLMFVISAIYAIIAMVIGILIFQYIRYSREVKEWGSAIVGLRLETATSSLLSLSQNYSKMRFEQYLSRVGNYALINDSMPPATPGIFAAPEEQSVNGNNEKLSYSLSPRKKLSSPKKSLSNKSMEEVAFDSNGIENTEPSLLESIAQAQLNTVAIEAVKKAAAANGLLFHPNMASYLEQFQSNWRPQILLFVKLDSKSGKVTMPKLLDFASQLKKANGLTICQSILYGDVLDQTDSFVSAAAEASLELQMEKAKVSGFASVSIGNTNLIDTAKVILQTSGIGLLRPNTVMLSWPRKWRASGAVPIKTPHKKKLPQEEVGEDDTDKGIILHKEAYVGLLKSCLGVGKALIVLKGIEEFPSNQDSSAIGTIDIWWLIHDGDLIVLISYLLLRHRIWRRCRLRLFTVTPYGFDDELSLGDRLRAHLNELRINAEVIVVQLQARDVRDLDENRTVIIKQDPQILQGDNRTNVLNDDFFKAPSPEQSQPAAIDNSSKTSLPELSLDTARAEKELEERLKAKASLIEKAGGTSESMKIWEENYKDRMNVLDSLLSPAATTTTTTSSSGGNNTLSATPTAVDMTFSPVAASSGSATANDSMEVSISKTPSDSNLLLKKKKSNNTTSDNKLVKGLLGRKLSSVFEVDDEELELDDSKLPRTKSVKSLLNDATHLESPRRQVQFKEEDKNEEEEKRSKQRTQMRYQTAKRLNAKMIDRSKDAQLVVLNLPLTRKLDALEFVKYTEILTQGIKKCVLIRGSGGEIVSDYR